MGKLFWLIVFVGCLYFAYNKVQANDSSIKVPKPRSVSAPVQTKPASRQADLFDAAKQSVSKYNKAVGKQDASMQSMQGKSNE